MGHARCEMRDKKKVGKVRNRVARKQRGTAADEVGNGQDSMGLVEGPVEVESRIWGVDEEL